MLYVVSPVSFQLGSNFGFRFQPVSLMRSSGTNKVKTAVFSLFDIMN
jgi:hypothetical protein